MLTSCESEKPTNLSSPQEDMSTRPRCSMNSFLPGLNLQTGLPMTLPWNIFRARSRCHHRWLWSRFVTSTPARRSLAHLQPETGKIYMSIVYEKSDTNRSWQLIQAQQLWIVWNSNFGIGLKHGPWRSGERLLLCQTLANHSQSIKSEPEPALLTCFFFRTENIRDTKDPEYWIPM